MEIGDIKFTEIVKLIHPDVNPDIKDPVDKMSRILMYRDEPATLYRLARDWGLVGIKNGKLVMHNTEPVNKTKTKKIPSLSNIKCRKITKTKKIRGNKINIGDNIFVKTIDKIVTVRKITPKRYYFSDDNGKVRFCNKKNAIKI